MRLGDTFLNAAGRGVQPHLWLVLSDPQRDPERVVIANLNSIREETPADEAGCRLRPGDHPFVDRASYVNFSEARVIPLAQLRALAETGRLQLHQPCDPALLRRVQQALAESRHASLRCYQVLDEQGLFLE